MKVLNAVKGLFEIVWAVIATILIFLYCLWLGLIGQSEKADAIIWGDTTE